MWRQLVRSRRRVEDEGDIGSDQGMAAQGSAQGGDTAHRFYISSPFLGLQKEREEAKQLITRQNHAYGDSYGGSPDPLVETCQRDVRASDHYILILGERYGTRRPEHGGKSVTEMEFEAAVEAGLSLHAFFLGFVSDARNGIERDADAHEALKAFRERVRDRCTPVDCSDQRDGGNGWQVFSERIATLAVSPPEAGRRSKHQRTISAHLHPRRAADLGGAAPEPSYDRLPGPAVGAGPGRRMYLWRCV